MSKAPIDKPYAKCNDAHNEVLRYTLASFYEYLQRLLGIPGPVSVEDSHGLEPTSSRFYQYLISRYSTYFWLKVVGVSSSLVLNVAISITHLMNEFHDYTVYNANSRVTRMQVLRFPASPLAGNASVSVYAGCSIMSRNLYCI